MPLLALSGLCRTGPAASPPGDTLGHLALTSVGCVVCYQKLLCFLLISTVSILCNSIYSGGYNLFLCKEGC